MHAARLPSTATDAFVIVPTSGDQIINEASSAVIGIFCQVIDAAMTEVLFEQDEQQANVFYTTSQRPREERKAAFQALWRAASPYMEQLSEHSGLDLSDVKTFWMRLAVVSPPSFL